MKAIDGNLAFEYLSEAAPVRSRITTTTWRLPFWLIVQPAIPAVLDVVCRFDIPAEVGAVDFRNLAFAADMRAFHFRGDGFADFVGEDESGFVLNIDVTR